MCQVDHQWASRLQGPAADRAVEGATQQVPIADRDSDGVDWALVADELELAPVLGDLADLDPLLCSSIGLFVSLLLH